MSVSDRDGDRCEADVRDERGRGRTAVTALVASLDLSGLDAGGDESRQTGADMTISSLIRLREGKRERG